MTKFVYCLIGITLLLTGALVSAKDLYVAQASTGANAGTGCSNAHSAAWFNSSSNWGAGATQINSGDTVHLCGVIASYLTPQADGAVNKPTVILFEPNAKISLTYFTSTAGLLNLNNRSWITVDGGSNGIIELTDNGTAGTKGHQSDGYGISISGASNFTIKNLTIQNLYVRTGTSDSNGWGYAIFGPSAVSGTNRITNNVMHDMSTCMIFNVNGSMEIDHNDCSRVSWGFASGGGSPTKFLFHDNKLYDGYVWYQVNDVFHNDAFHIWTSGGKWNNASVYNNDFTGDWGGFTTGLIYLECDHTADSCPLLIYNNLFHEKSALTNGMIALKDAIGVRIFNNYFSGPGNAIHQENGGAGGSSGTVAQNNIFSNVGAAFAEGPTPNSWGTRDYNVLYNANQSKIGSHDITANPALDSNFMPTASSPVVDSGSSQASYFTTDAAGTSRPQGNAWDIGPYEYSAIASNKPAPPSGVVASVN